MEKSIIANSVNSGNLSSDNAGDNPDPSSIREKEQRLFRKEVRPSGRKRRRPGKGLWFDGEVCKSCNTTEHAHHAKGLCKRCYCNRWISNNPDAVRSTARKSYRTNIENRKIWSLGYYKDNCDRIKARVIDLYRNKSFDGNMIKALERDNYTCQNPDCKGHSKRIDVHHIDGNGIHSNKPNHKLSNLICLCASCHTKLHSGHDIVWSALKKVAAERRVRK